MSRTIDKSVEGTIKGGLLRGKIKSQTLMGTFNPLSMGTHSLSWGAGYSSDIFLYLIKIALRTQFQYVLDMSLNTIRLESKQQRTEFYKLAD